MGQTPLLLLPGMLCDSTVWQHQLEHLIERACPTVGNLTAAETVAELAEAVLANAPQQFALAGLSMGGIVAFEILRQAPQRVSRLALLNTNPGPASATQHASFDRFNQLIEQNKFNEITSNHLLPNLLHPDHMKNQRLVTHIEQMAKTVGPAAYQRQMAAVAGRPDSRPDLGQIKCPTLVLVGRQDKPCPVAMHQAMATAIPHGKLVVIEQCGHLSSLEQPQAVTALLQYWLQQVD